MKKIRYLLLFLFVILIAGCGSSEKAFLENYKYSLANKDDTYEIPSYSYSQNSDGVYEVIDGVEFVQQNHSYKFRDWSRTNEGDKDLITFSIDITGFVEFYHNAKVNWKYSYMYYSPKIFDYYTGELYHSSELSPDGSVTLTGKFNDDNDQMKYTDIKFDGETYKIGMSKEGASAEYKDPVIKEYEDGRLHMKTPTSVTVTYRLEVPKDYDGVMIAILKNGITKETFEEIMNKDQRIKELEKQKAETGEESEELKKLKEDNKKTSIIDINKDNIDNYFLLSTKDIFNIKKPEKTNNLPLIIGISVAALVLVLLVIFLIIKKKNKTKKSKKVVEVKEEKKDTKKNKKTTKKEK